MSRELEDMGTRIRVFEDIGFTIVAGTPPGFKGVQVNFEIYEHEATRDDGAILYHRRGADHYPDAVEGIASAQLFAHGRVKWDGCSDWEFDQLDEKIFLFHGCSRADLVNLGEVLARCRDFAAGLIDGNIID